MGMFRFSLCIQCIMELLMYHNKISYVVFFVPLQSGIKKNITVTKLKVRKKFVE